MTNGHLQLSSPGGSVMENSSVGSSCFCSYWSFKLSWKWVLNNKNRLLQFPPLFFPRIPLRFLFLFLPSFQPVSIQPIQVSVLLGYMWCCFLRGFYTSASISHPLYTQNSSLCVAKYIRNQLIFLRTSKLKRCVTTTASKTLSRKTNILYYHNNVNNHIL